jgi:DNA-directed RNA polymerase alpha subunit
MSKKCPVTQGKVDLSLYDKLDSEWKKMGLAAPARRALINAKLTKVTDLKKITEKDLMSLHGMGPSSLPVIKREMKKIRIKFKA